MSEQEWETSCPGRKDQQHCNCWYDGEACCGCGDGERLFVHLLCNCCGNAITLPADGPAATDCVPKGTIRIEHYECDICDVGNSRGGGEQYFDAAGNPLEP